MSTPLSNSLAIGPKNFGLGARIAVICAVLAAETFALSYLIQNNLASSTGGAADSVREVQHWLFRFLIAYVASFVTLLYVGRRDALGAIATAANDAPVRLRWLLAHALILAPFAWLSAVLYAPASGAPFWLLALGWHACAVAALAALIAAMAPLAVWSAALEGTGRVALYALAPALGAVVLIRFSQMLWAPAARLTFRIVVLLLQPLPIDLYSQPDDLILGTPRFAAEVSEVCSGLEGVGLMLVFCVAWLWYFRREYFFPRALLIVPVALLLVFMMNAVRIAAILLIGDAGYPRVASVGFHSQAGWIAFNFVAFSVAWFARRSPALNRYAATHRVPAAIEPAAIDGARHGENLTAPYLMPLLAILAAGMLAHAMSAGFESLYPLRLIAAVAVLWMYRRTLSAVNWRFGWLGVAAGIAVFLLWIVLTRTSHGTAAMPQALAQMSPVGRAAWILCRALAASLTVPIAEELAYRGYLMRRVSSPEFDQVMFKDVRWPSLALSSVAFGLMHGSMWIAGTIAGVLFGLVAIVRNRLGEAVAAHATANALLAVTVLLFDQWQLW